MAKSCQFKIVFLHCSINFHFTDEKVCPSSVQNYFQSKDVLCSKIKVDKSVFNYCDFRVPVISPEQFCPDGGADHSTESCDYLEVYEWLGACATGVDL